MSIRVAILTVSDSAHLNPLADKSGPVIKDLVSGYGCQVVQNGSAIVPDEADPIKNKILEWSHSTHVDWIITTGGTGFGVRDITPEVVSSIIEKPAPGLIHLLLSSGLKHTPFAALSRPVAGVYRKTIITTLPGSVKAVEENLLALFEAGLITHAIDLAKGGDSRQLHREVSSGLSVTDFSRPTSRQSETIRNRSRSSVRNDSQTSDTTASRHGQRRHHHHHHHRDGSHRHKHHDHSTPIPRSQEALSHDPLAPASTRHRKSPYPLISFENALGILSDVLQTLPIETVKVTEDLSSYILAEDIYSSVDVPSRPTTSVDGYAIRSSDPPGVYKVVTSLTHPINAVLPAGHAYRINTGGPLPTGTDTVIMVEDTRLVSVYEDESDQTLYGEEKEIETLAQIPIGENVRAPGSDVVKGELVMKAGDKISKTGGDIATLAFIGRREVKVYRKPVVAVVSTGNELVDFQNSTGHNDTEEWGGIYDTNRPALLAALREAGYPAIDLGIIKDDVASHIETLKKGLTEADFVITTGGTSMGPTDLLKPVIERYLNGTIHFGRVGIKPGKPTTFATVPISAGGATVQKPIFALPGNPASALVTFYVFVIPSLRRLGGWPHHQCSLPKALVQVQNPMPFDPRIEFHRVVVRSSARALESVPFGAGSGLDGFVLKAFSTGGQRSSRAGSLSGANGLVILPPLLNTGTEARRTGLVAGDYAQALLIGEVEACP